MLTEGWDCQTVTHIIGLRPFMSQLLCEQVVGRGLRRASYEPGESGLLREEVAKVLVDQPPAFEFPPQAHWDLGPALGILDFERGAKIAGARFSAIACRRAK